jgi:hypothetical protein
MHVEHHVGSNAQFRSDRRRGFSPWINTAEQTTLRKRDRRRLLRAGAVRAHSCAPASRLACAAPSELKRRDESEYRLSGWAEN